MDNHYTYLEKHLPAFFAAIGLKRESVVGIIVAHGDKAYGYRHQWEEVGLKFNHGVAIYLVSYCFPYSKEVRETEHGWVDPCKWVIGNKDRFVKFLP